MRPDAAVIVVAGGQGVRFGGSVRKQYLRLARRPILWWSLRAFERSPSIGGLVFVLPREELARGSRRVRRWHLEKLIHVVAGGVTRADSVASGLKAVPRSFRWVAVHDAVRPLVTVTLIEKTLREARRHRAAIAALPSKDTVKLATPSGRILRTPPRESVWLAQTPQIFERNLLERAHQRWTGSHPTDDAQMVERLGVRIQLVESFPENMKVTVPSDLVLAEALLKERK